MPFLNGIFGGNHAGGDAARQGGDILRQGGQDANSQYWGGEGRALRQYDVNHFDPYSWTGGQANSMYANALGLNGPGGNRAATGAFQASPGYNFQLGQGVQALDRSAAGSGMFGSGNAAMALNQYGQGLANQDYGNWMSRLGGLGSQGLQAAAGQTGRQGAMAGINEWGAGGRGAADLDVARNRANMLYQGQMADAGANAQGGANLFNAIGGGLNLLGGFLPRGGGFLSDRRDKTDIERLGKDKETGLPMYSYRYKHDPKTTLKIVGPMADDIEKRRPDLVSKIGGHKVISGNWLRELSKAA